jgi:superoxide reductase
MPVKHFGEIWKCSICKNKVEVIDAGGGTLVCCNKEMKMVEDDRPSTTVNIADSGG